MENPDLVQVYYPHNLIPAITALRWLREENGDPPDGAATVVVRTQRADPARKERLYETVRILAQAYPWLSVWAPTDDELKRYFSAITPVPVRAGRLRSRFGPRYFDRIFYPHNVAGDFTAQSLFSAFPDAKRICYGDSLGIVYSPSGFEAMNYDTGGLYESLRNPWTTAKNFLLRLARMAMAPRAGKNFEPHQYALLIPAQLGGDTLGATLPTIPDKEMAHKTIRAFQMRVPDYMRKVDEALNCAGERAYLFPMANFAEALCMSQEGEIELYRRILMEYVPVGSTIILKPHPGAEPSKTERLARSLAQKYDIRLFDAEGSLVPMELADRLARECEVLSVAYTSVSLPYLYGTKIKHLLDDRLIDEFVNRAKRKWVRTGNDFYLFAIDNMEKWDGESVFYPPK